MGSELEYALTKENGSLSNNAFIILPATSTKLFIKRQLYQMMSAFELKAPAKAHPDGGKLFKFGRVENYRDYGVDERGTGCAGC